MMLRKISALALLAWGCLTAEVRAYQSPSSNPTKDKVLMELILQCVQFNHYAPKALDDDFSEKWFNLYLQRLDNSKRFFLQSDVDQLSKFKKQLDDQATNGDYIFFDEAIRLFEGRYKLVKGYYQEFLGQPFSFDSEETIETDGEKLPYAKNEAELKERWRKNLKFQVLSGVQMRLERQEDAQAKKDTTLKIKSFAEIEKEEREKVLKNYDNWAKNLEKDKREDRLAFYLNAYAGVLEPHSEYFPPLEKENFDIKMSGKLEGIGAQLREEDGYIKVARVVPGSASARQGELEVNDKIIKVAQGNEEPVDVVDMKIDDVLPMIRGKKGTEVRLTVKKTDGTVKIIPIIRDVVVLEDSYAKSAIIESKKNKMRVGLIDLRTFYADFEDPNGRRCAKDVRREVQKLVAEEVDGIVIDLRFNGGGSLMDVVDMTGLFIDKGPIVQVKSKNAEPALLEDKDVNVLYDGPLVIMVNSYSASASEIMAAALQDYGRAVIVGTSPTTFGKGTVQRFFNFDEVVPLVYRSLGELGSMKITIQKFYRINGGSTQLKGVEPDIVLPNQYSMLKAGEQEEDFPMAWTEIKPATYKIQHSIPHLDKIKKKSHKRVAANDTYKLIEEHAHWLKAQQDASAYPLNLAKYQAQRKADEDKAKKFKNLYDKDIADLSINSLAADLPALQGDTIRLEGVKAWHKALQKDFYLEEVMNVIHDWRHSKYAKSE